MLERLKYQIPQFEWKYNQDSDSYFGIGKVDSYEFRDKDKNLVIRSDKIIFISGELYKGTGIEFRYCICYQKEKIRKYRHKHFIEIEGNKLYFSGKNLLEDLLVRRFNSPEFIKFIIEGK